jgi:hypothetical protein
MNQNEIKLNRENSSDIVEPETIDTGTSDLTVGGSTAKPVPQNIFSQSEANKFLYETRLQDVFNDYQRNVSTLDKQKQEQLQDAYYIREMSKKYLGEYASNIGVGDVSGNLLDIYGQYQQNKSDIDRYYNQLELGLQQTYSDERFKLMSGILQEQFNINLEGLEANARDILFNISQGNTDGLDDFEYLKREADRGQLTPELYQTAVLGLQELNFQELYTTLENDAFLVNNESAVDFVEANKDKMGKKQYEALLTFAQAKDMEKRVEDTTTPKAIDIDPTQFTNDRNVDEDSKTFEIAGINYATVKQSVEDDRFRIGDERVKNLVNTSDLNTRAAELGTNFVYDAPSNSYFFRDTDNKWYRMVSIAPSSSTGASLSNIYAKTFVEGSPNFKVKVLPTEAGSQGQAAGAEIRVTIGDIEYQTRDNTSPASFSGSNPGVFNENDPSISDVRNAFLETHPITNRRGQVYTVKNKSAVEFDGKFYFYMDNKIYELERR